ncbi:hypothetical protein FQN57_005856 [Myotisia sp. PD_48]|nr:hypothetical protein FQN57_005856 [Myotisia sp. PD_48]
MVLMPCPRVQWDRQSQRSSSTSEPDGRPAQPAPFDGATCAELSSEEQQILEQLIFCSATSKAPSAETQTLTSTRSFSGFQNLRRRLSHSKPGRIKFASLSGNIRRRFSRDSRGMRPDSQGVLEQPSGHNKNENLRDRSHRPPVDILENANASEGGYDSDAHNLLTPQIIARLKDSPFNRTSDPSTPTSKGRDIIEASLRENFCVGYDGTPARVQTRLHRYQGGDQLNGSPPSKILQNGPSFLHRAGIPQFVNHLSDDEELTTPCLQEEHDQRPFSCGQQDIEAIIDHSSQSTLGNQDATSLTNSMSTTPKWHFTPFGPPIPESSKESSLSHNGEIEVALESDSTEKPEAATKGTSTPAIPINGHSAIRTPSLSVYSDTRSLKEPQIPEKSISPLNLEAPPISPPSTPKYASTDGDPVRNISPSNMPKLRAAACSSGLASSSPPEQNIQRRCSTGPFPYRSRFIEHLDEVPHPPSEEESNPNKDVKRGHGSQHSSEGWLTGGKRGGYGYSFTSETDSQSDNSEGCGNPGDSLGRDLSAAAANSLDGTEDHIELALDDLIPSDGLQLAVMEPNSHSQHPSGQSGQENISSPSNTRQVSGKTMNLARIEEGPDDSKVSTPLNKQSSALEGQRNSSPPLQPRSPLAVSKNNLPGNQPSRESSPGPALSPRWNQLAPKISHKPKFLLTPEESRRPLQWCSDGASSDFGLNQGSDEKVAEDYFPEHLTAEVWSQLYEDCILRPSQPDDASTIRSSSPAMIIGNNASPIKPDFERLTESWNVRGSITGTMEE